MQGRRRQADNRAQYTDVVIRSHKTSRGGADYAKRRDSLPTLFASEPSLIEPLGVLMPFF